MGYKAEIYRGYEIIELDFDWFSVFKDKIEFMGKFKTQEEAMEYIDKERRKEIRKGKGNVSRSNS